MARVSRRKANVCDRSGCLFALASLLLVPAENVSASMLAGMLGLGSRSLTFSSAAKSRRTIQKRRGSVEDFIVKDLFCSNRTFKHPTAVTMSSSSSECLSELESELNLYWGVVGASLGLTVLNLLVCSVCLARRFQSNPHLAVKVYLTTGSIKILLGILILTVFHVKCPSDCVCSGIQYPNYTYGVVVLVVGLLWMRRAMLWHKRAQEGMQGEGTDGKGIVIPVPSAEMV